MATSEFKNLSSFFSDTQADGSIAIRTISKPGFRDWYNSLSQAEKNWVDANEFTGARHSHLKFSNGEGKVSSVILGLGEGEESADPWAFGGLAKALPAGDYHLAEKTNPREFYHAAMGWALGQYKFSTYLKKDKDKASRLYLPETQDRSLISSVVRSTFLVRNLVNTPTCDMGPDALAEAAAEVAKEFSAACEVTVGDELLEKGYNAIHTVGRAAEKAPRLIDFTWGDEGAPKVTLVGKGVCFDTGGLDLKPSSAMLLMKKDMGGAAHVLGLARLIMEQKLNLRLRVLIPAVENNVSGNAFRPGDVIRTYKGKTVEVGNTDAEGRLVLCDALALAAEEKPDLMIDFATLTGAARVALGPDIPPFFTDSQKLADGLGQHAIREGDPVWRLPLYGPYLKFMDSDIADLNNNGSSPFGGAITAALFMREFTEGAGEWLHLDVYAWNQSNRPGRPKGGEAMALRTVYSYLHERFKN
ncbi:leucyl aminopeptidase family protein [Emcibacter nanhaiensis]|uniref:Leucyl aminopeptidase family protein n=1 Tax=Emcibacter nanhaiensis TaxID=1505037 RepID=A0A501PCX4_9PROT|nr:leucyl aminopeptidase family protein [Emcibacter nanhaiensis]TPD57816.1 leucyl aminopeptidase family protein [Emcibacter nanhaiensis]